jgi:hypothetical protein
VVDDEQAAVGRTVERDDIVIAVAELAALLLNGLGVWVELGRIREDRVAPRSRMSPS